MPRLRRWFFVREAGWFVAERLIAMLAPAAEITD
jgi:hypothetical protein